MLCSLAKGMGEICLKKKGAGMEKKLLKEIHIK